MDVPRPRENTESRKPDAAEADEAEAREEREMLNPTIPLSDSRAWVRLERKVAKYSEEIRMTPMLDVTARAMESATILKKWSIRSRNLKGTVKKETADTACYMQATVAALAASSITATAIQDIIRKEDNVTEVLKEEIKALRAEILILKSETKRLKEGEGVRKRTGIKKTSHSVKNRQSAQHQQLDRGKGDDKNQPWHTPLPEDNIELEEDVIHRLTAMEIDLR